jgi:hypothetical protein
MQAVGRLGRISMTDVIGEDEEILCDVEWLARSEENIRKDWIQQSVAISSSAMKEKDGIVHMTVGSAMRLTKCQVMQCEFRKCLASAETEILNDVDVVLYGPLGDRLILRNDSKCAEEGKADYCS